MPQTMPMVNMNPWAYMPPGMPPPMAMICFDLGSPWGPASMVTFSIWDDDTAAYPTTGEEIKDRSDDGSEYFVTVEDLLACDEGMSADFLAGHRACYADEDGRAPLADALADLASQIWTKGQVI